MSTSQPGSKSLASKLAEVMAAVHSVPKRGTNQHFGYDFATESDIVAAVRKELADRHVVLIPSVDEYTTQELAAKSDGKGGEKTRDPLTILKMTFTFMDGESGESIAKPWIGVGQDGGDKGAYKAMTGGEKYFLLKTFLIPTGDDPERSEAIQGKRQQARAQARGAVDPPDKVVDAKTGEEVPAATRPVPPVGFYYLDGYRLKNGWHEIEIRNYGGKAGATMKLSTKKDIGYQAGAAFQNGVPVRVTFSPKAGKAGEGYLDTVEKWTPAKQPDTRTASDDSPDYEAPPLTDADIPF